MVALDQVLCEMRSDMALSVILQILGYSQREIAAVGGRHQQGIGYHVDQAKRAMGRG
jgi:hypothetical protein